MHITRSTIGMDEVGRGAWAGPFVAGALWLRPGDRIIRGLKDSKQYLPRRREEIAEKLQRRHVWALGIVTIEELNIIGLGQAQILVFERALENLRPVIARSRVDEAIHNRKIATPRMARLVPPLARSGIAMTTGKASVLIDGRPIRSHPEWSAIVDGDEHEYAIAAASVIAKVARDRMMAEFHQRHDQRYRFDLHKGYGTRLHQQKLLEYGVSPYHRQQFRPIKAYRGA